MRGGTAPPTIRTAMFMLYAIPVGLAVGLLMHGRLAALSDVRLRWSGAAVVGLLAQLVLFAPPVAARVGDEVGPVLYVGSSALVLAVVLRNIRLPGLAIVAVGAASNLAAIVANGGWMPASAGALASLGASIGDGYSNSRILGSPAVLPLTDLFALPAWMPFANVFSVGDVLIGAGVAIAIVAAMRRPVGAGAPPIRQPDWYA